VAVSLKNERLQIIGATAADAPFWADYFALDVDYDAIVKLMGRNPVLRTCVEFSPGIRVLRQEFFEILITFIISANNNIKRIRGIIERMCSAFGDHLGESPGGSHLYSFPEPGVMAALDPSDLECLRAGYRVKSIIDAAQRTASGDIDEKILREMPTDAARGELLKVHGVGPKVADCVLLFGLGRFECFPVDVWIRRAMDVLFAGGLPESVEKIAGIAQQYIFHYVRSTDIIKSGLKADKKSNGK
jgi:N-glycosylase/DNA lyase